MAHDAPAADLQRALAGLHRSARFPLVYGGAVTQDKELRISTLLGNAGESLRGVRVISGRGLGGRALTTRRAVAVGDYYSSDTISHDFDDIARSEAIKSLVAVPVIVRRRTRAVLYGAIRDTGVLGDVSVSAVASAARELEQDLAVRDEVERRIAELAAHHRCTATAPSAEREALRRGHAELRVISNTLTDPTLRARVDGVCATLMATPASRSAPGLSQRELDVLACVAIGYTNAEAAQALAIAAETAKSYLRSAMRKLDTHSRVQTVNVARSVGLLP